MVLTKRTHSKPTNKSSPKSRQEFVQIGDIVTMRVRLEGYFYGDEPYDIIHANQPFGYVNSKYRPCVLIGQNDNNLVLAPCYTADNIPPQMEMQHGGILLTKDEMTAANLYRSDAADTFVSCANLIQIPKDEFCYTKQIGSLPLPTLIDYTKELISYYDESETNPHALQKTFDLNKPKGLKWLNQMSFDTKIKRQSFNKSTRIHPHDPDAQLDNALHDVITLRNPKHKLHSKLNQALDVLAAVKAVGMKDRIISKSQFNEQMKLHKLAQRAGTYNKRHGYQRLSNLPDFKTKVLLELETQKRQAFEKMIPKAYEPDSMTPLEKTSNPPKTVINQPNTKTSDFDL